MIELPKEPVDQFTFEGYVVADGHFPGISFVRYVYHVNTPWDKYSPDRGGGAPIVDDWMIYNRSCDPQYNSQLTCDGRRHGWESIRPFVARLTTIEGAREQLQAILLRDVKNAKARVAELLQKLNAVGEWK